MVLECSRALCVVVLASIVAGCASIPAPAIRHILMFDGDGHPLDPTGNVGCLEAPVVQSRLCRETDQPFRDMHLKTQDHPRLTDNYYERAYLPAHLRCMDAYFGATAPPNGCTPGLEPPKHATRKVLIFVHGGLNTQVASLERVSTPTKDRRAMYAEIADAGFYPLFVNWQSSLVSSYVEQLVYIRQG